MTVGCSNSGTQNPKTRTHPPSTKEIHPKPDSCRIRSAKAYPSCFDLSACTVIQTSYVPRILMQRLLIAPSRRAPRNRGFTLVEIMVVVVIIGLLVAMALPAYRKITMRSKTAALVSDLRSYSTAFITYNLQNG